MSYELIQAKMGFDSSAFTAGADKVNAKATDMNKQFSQVNEALGKFGLSVLAPLALFGKLATAVWEFGKNAKDSTNEAERSMYQFTQQAEGMFDGVIQKSAQFYGRIVQLGDSFVNFAGRALENIGVVTKGSSDLNDEVARTTELARNAHEELAKVADLNLKIAQTKDKIRAADEASLPVATRIASVQEQIAKAQETLNTAAKNSREAKQAELTILEKGAELRKLETEQAKENSRSADIISKARADGIEQERKISEEKSKQAEAQKKIADDSKKSADSETVSVSAIQATAENLEKATTPSAQVADEMARVADNTKKAADDAARFLTLSESTAKVRINRIGSGYESQSDYQLKENMQRLFLQMEDTRSKNIGGTAPEWLAKLALKPYEVEIDAIKKELQQRKDDARLAAEEAAWQKENGIKAQANDEKMLSISERMEEQLRILNQRMSANGFSTNKQS